MTHHINYLLRIVLTLLIAGGTATTEAQTFPDFVIASP